MKLHVIAAIFGMLIGVVTPALMQSSKASSKDQQLIAELAKKWEAAYNRKDAAGVAALDTENTVEVSPKGIFLGRVAIPKRVDAALKAGGHDLSFGIKDVQSSGNVITSARAYDATYGSQPVNGY